MANQDKLPLTEVLKILKDKGLRPVDYRHLDEAGLRKLAGVK